MTNIVEFPGLGISFEMSRVAFTIFGFPVFWYGIIIGFGLLLAVAFGFRQAPRYGIDTDRMIDVVLVGFIAAILGGRLFYVLFSDMEITSFWQLFDLRGGGIAIYGAIIGAFVGGGLTAKWRKVPVLPMLDLGGMGFLIGQSIGRWGNFVNQEAFGTNTALPWGMKSAATTRYLTMMQPELAAQGVTVNPALPVHPTFLYESLWCAVGFLLIFLYSKRRKFNGELILMYVVWYGTGRFFIEGLRTDSLMTLGGNMRVSQALAALSVLAALVIWVVARVKTAGKPLVIPTIPPHTADVRIDTADGTQTVTIEWPANTKAPARKERRLMAQEAWAADAGAAQSDDETPDDTAPAKTDEDTD